MEKAPEDRYLYTHVLLMCWQEADQAFKDVLAGLKRTFDTDFNYDAQVYEIPSNEPYSAATVRLLEFLKNDAPDTLLILYYGGHGSADSDNHLIWRLHSSGEPSLDGTSLQQLVFGKTSDVLILLDCCSAASAVRERQNGNVEGIMSCSSHEKTPVTGEHCFTQKLTKILRKHCVRGGIEVYDLYHSLYQDYNKAGSGRGRAKAPVYTRPGKELKHTIFLRRMESFHTSKTTITKATKSYRRASISSGTGTVYTVNMIQDDGAGMRGEMEDAETLNSAETAASIYFSACDKGSKEDVETVSLAGRVLIPLQDDDDIQSNGQDLSSTPDFTASENTTLRDSDDSAQEFQPASISLSPVISQNHQVITSTLNSLNGKGDVHRSGTENGQHSYEILRLRPGATSDARRRILHELCALHREGQQGKLEEFLTLGPISYSDVFEWQATIKGPPDTPYEGGIFHLRISMTGLNYPLVPPRIWFDTPIYHPNVGADGAICASHLTLMANVGWSPLNTIRSAIMCLFVVFSEPVAEDPLRDDIAAQLRERPKEFEEVARRWTREYATGAVFGREWPSVDL